MKTEFKTYEDFKAYYEKNKWKFWLNQKCADAKAIWDRYHQEILMYGPAAITALLGAAKFVNRKVELHQEKALRDNYTYDRTINAYLKHRKLSKNETIELAERKSKGEKLVDILSSMKALR